MATTDLSAVKTGIAFTAKMMEAMTEANALFASGIAVTDSEITRMLSGGSNIAHLDHYSKINDQEPNYSSDNPAEIAAARALSSAKQIIRSASRNNVFSSMDLAASLTHLEDPSGAVAGQIGGVWSTDGNVRLSNGLRGIYADNVANDSGDMLYGIANDDALVGGEVPAEATISGIAINNALQTLGDAKSQISAIGLHSQQHTTLGNKGLLRDVHDPATGNVMYQTYNGLRVIVDDALPTTTGTNRTTYTAVLYGAGSIGFGKGNVKVPNAIQREELGGNGGGEELLISRVNDTLHPYGFSFLSASVAGESPTRAELATATNWDRVVDRKNVALAFLDTNG